MKNPFRADERKVVSIACAIVFARMSALFLPLPVFSSLAQELEFASFFSAGFAIGIYALMQASLQIPLGIVSDKFGRKRVIVGALAIFLLGSILCAVANDIYTFIFARFIQGLGAVSSALTALVADETRENQRAKAMALIGASVGVAFFVCTLISPMIVSSFGLNDIFWVISFLACNALFLSLFLGSRPQKNKESLTISHFLILLSPKLIFLDLGVFLGHFILSTNFFVLPLMLIHSWGIELYEHWKVYLLALLFSIPAMAYTVYLTDKLGRIKTAFNFAFLSLMICQLLFIYHDSLVFLIVGFLIFFSGFSSLETLLPTLASSQASQKNRGFVMGFFTTNQQLGSALGAIFAGWLSTSGSSMIFVCNLFLLTALFIFGFKVYPQFLSKDKIQAKGPSQLNN